MYEHIYTHIWMLVPQNEHQVIANAFDLSKSGVTEVRDSDVITDGYTNDDLAGITPERMAEYVGSDEPFMRLWELTVAKARSVVHPAAPFPQSQAATVEKRAPEEQEARLRTFARLAWMFIRQVIVREPFASARRRITPSSSKVRLRE